MKFEIPLEEGRFVKRYKRFFADVLVDGNETVVHVPNTGSLKGCLVPGTRALLSTSLNPARKLSKTLEFLEVDGSWVGVNTHRSNHLVWEVWEKALHPHWHQFDQGKKEIKINAATRLDLRLSQGDRHHFVEVKNVTMKVAHQAQFPDSESMRAQKHLKEMMLLMEQGHSAEIVFTVQRSDCTAFSTADEIDKNYGVILREAIKKGLKISAWPCEISPEGVHLVPSRSLDIEL